MKNSNNVRVTYLLTAMAAMTPMGLPPCHRCYGRVLNSIPFHSIPLYSFQKMPATRGEDDYKGEHIG